MRIEPITHPHEESWRYMKSNKYSRIRIHPNLCNVTSSLISPTNRRERMCSTQTSLFVVTFPFHISLGKSVRMVEDLGGLEFHV